MHKKLESRLVAAEIRYLRKVAEKTRRDHISNITVRDELQQKSIMDIVEMRALGWVGHLVGMENGMRAKQLAIDQKRSELANRRGVVFHQDNSRPHMAIVTRQKFRELGWEVLMHPPYSTTPSDYHVFLALQNFLSDKKLASREDCENRLLEFFANRDQDFYERGIMKLPLKWQKIIEQNGA
ncbi:PREDICTED: histone-lysine N-methyltransferase SETMAR-like, partial [Dinoponera quadriceps]|uniref:Histone-lysine N-methyltransferase SETMAR-like n=1 Tax=Dinoponera quadriceps TaxID=609295 RepID=A0A6P3XB98_DINQU